MNITSPQIVDTALFLLAAFASFTWNYQSPTKYVTILTPLIGILLIWTLDISDEGYNYFSSTTIAIWIAVEAICKQTPNK